MIDYGNILLRDTPVQLTDFVPTVDNDNVQTRRTIAEIKALVSVPEGQYNVEYTGTITTDGTPPSGIESHRFSWERSAGASVVNLNLFINYEINGGTISEFRASLPLTCPLPLLVDGLGAADDVLYNGSASMQVDKTTYRPGFCSLRVNAAGDWYDLVVVGDTEDLAICNISISYFSFIQSGSSSS